MPFEAWALVEIMGHQRVAGKVSEEVIAGTAMLRVDVPAINGRDGYTKYYAAGALYCLTPTDEATATRAAEQFNVPPISPYILHMPESPMLAAKVAEPGAEYDDYGYPDSEYADEDDFDDYDEDWGDDQTPHVAENADHNINEPPF